MSDEIKIAVYASNGFPSTVEQARELRDCLKRFIEENKDNQTVTLVYATKQPAIKIHIHVIRAIINVEACAPVSGSADHVRNRMNRECTHAVIFWDGQSTGTKKFIELWEKTDKPFALVMVD